MTSSLPEERGEAIKKDKEWEGEEDRQLILLFPPKKPQFSLATGGGLLVKYEFHGEILLW